MSDARLRQLERAAATGGWAEQRALLAERHRVDGCAEPSAWPRHTRVVGVGQRVRPLTVVEAARQIGHDLQAMIEVDAMRVLLSPAPFPGASENFSTGSPHTLL